MATIRDLQIYIDRKWSLIPLNHMVDGLCSCGDPNCPKPGKHPKIAKYLEKSSNNKYQIESWLREFPGCNWGFVPGKSNILVIDIDIHSGADINALGELPDTLTVSTPGPGFHKYFKKPGDQYFDNGHGDLPKFWDVRCDKGYVILPPSNHYSGGYYSWYNQGAIADAPQIILDRIESKRDREKPLLKLPEKIKESGRNDTLFKAGCSMKSTGFDDAAILSALLVQNTETCDPPLEDIEVETIANSVAKYEPGNKLEADFDKSTDRGIAERFANFAHETVRYLWIGIKGNWMIWTGKVWLADAEGEIYRKIDDFIPHLLLQGSQAPKAEREIFERSASHMESNSGRERMLKVAQSNILFATVSTDYDKDKHLFNCNNGIIDLMSGDLLEHDSKYMLTQISPFDYDPNARSELWERCLNDWTGSNSEMIGFLQRSIGYSMVGYFEEKHFWFLYGKSNTAKTTFLELFDQMFGNYGDSAKIDVFLDKGKHIGGSVGPKPEILALRNLRFVQTEEAKQNSEFDTEFLKVLTGGGSTSARDMYSNKLESFIPISKVWFGSNWAPKASSIDQALWNRILVVPFSIEIEEQRQDKNLRNKLVSDPISSGAILAWMVQGCLAWREQGLMIPEEVKHQTILIQNENDELFDFKETCLEFTESFDDYVSCPIVYETYERWFAVNRLDPKYRKKNQNFYKLIEAVEGVYRSAQVEQKEDLNGRFFYGIKLKPRNAWDYDPI